MRTAWLLIIVLLPRSILAQLSGEYCADRGFETACLEFRGSNQFALHRSYCTGASEGHGHYKVEKKCLILTFDISNPIDTSTKILSSESTGDSFINIAINFFAEKDQHLEYAIASLAETNNGCQSDDNGHCDLRLKKSETWVVLEFDAVGFAKKPYRILPDSNYVLNVYFDEHQSSAEANPGEVRKYFIKQKGSTVIDLKLVCDKRGFESWIKK